jgi:hypothetical protein
MEVIPAGTQPKAKRPSSLTSGGFHAAVGWLSLGNLRTGNFNTGIDAGRAGSEANTIRIGNSQTGAFIGGISGLPVTATAVVVNIFGQLGVAPSSQRFKEDIKPMNKVSEALVGLNRLLFDTRKEIDPAGTSQFGLVAEDVE